MPVIAASLLAALGTTAAAAAPAAAAAGGAAAAASTAAAAVPAAAATVPAAAATVPAVSNVAAPTGKTIASGAKGISDVAKGGQLTKTAASAPGSASQLSTDLGTLYGNPADAAQGTAAADIGAKQGGAPVEGVLEGAEGATPDAGAGQETEELSRMDRLRNRISQASDAYDQVTEETATTPVEIASFQTPFRSAQLRRRYNMLSAGKTPYDVV